MKNIKYWIICGGDYDSIWESVVIADSMQDALKRFKRYRLSVYKSDIKAILKKNPSATGYKHFPEKVSVQKAQVSRQGVIQYIIGSEITKGEV